MQRFDDIISARVEDIISAATGKTLIFFKGFAIPQIQGLIRHPNALLPDPSLIEDGFLSLDTLNDKWFDLLTAIKQADAPLVGFYEELLVIGPFLDRVDVEKVVVVENNLLAPWAPCCFPYDLAL